MHPLPDDFTGTKILVGARKDTSPRRPASTGKKPPQQGVGVERVPPPPISQKPDTKLKRTLAVVPPPHNFKQAGRKNPTPTGVY